MRKPSDEAVVAAKHAYTAVARAADRALTSTHVLPATPPPRDRRLRHWAYSLTKVHNSQALMEMDVPWWTYRAIDAVEVWLSRRQRPVSVFEFGSGASTRWLARRADTVHSVENDAGFAAAVGTSLTGEGDVHLHVVEGRQSESPGTPSGKESWRGFDFTDYVSTIDRVGGTFDLVVVDGRARDSCLRAAVPHLAPDGLIVFDNSGRSRYRSAITGCGLTEEVLRGLTPTLPYPEQTSLLRRTSRG